MHSQGSPATPTAASRRRTYDTSGRAAAAEQRRADVVTAAERLFAERGFAATTVASVARAAGVSAPLVYAGFGSKAGLLAAMLTRLEERSDRDEWVERLEEEPDAAVRWRLFAAWSRTLYENGAAMIGAAYRGAGEDAAIAALRAEGDRRRRAGVRGLVERAAAEGRLAHRVGVETAVEHAQVLTSPALYLACTLDEGWPGDEYEQWISGLLVREMTEGSGK